MRFPHHGLQVDLDDDWWKEAGMAGFSPISRAYRTDPRFSETGEPALEVAIADVAPAPRPVGIFRDSEDGIPARERVVRILRRFRLDEAIPASLACVWMKVVSAFVKQKRFCSCWML